MKASRAQTAVVGEDLGTVPEGMRDELAGANILSYRVMRFEREGLAFARPRNYPALSAACVATHDLPPLAGWWQGVDLAEAAALGGLPDERQAFAARAVEKAELVERSRRRRFFSRGRRTRCAARCGDCGGGA